MHRNAPGALGLLVLAASLLLPAASATASPPPLAAASTATPSDAVSAEAPAPGGAPADVVRARVRTGAGDDVADATVRVEAGGQEVASGTTDDRGTAELAVPGPATYDVVLDVESLPDEVADLEPRQDTITVDVRSGEPRTVIFRLDEAGAAAAGGGGWLERLPQLLVSGLRFGLVIALAAIGLSLIFGTTGLTNFAHSELITFGALATWGLTQVGLPFLAAAALGLVLSAALGWANDRLLWQPLRRRGTGLIAMMIVSIGLAFLLRYLYLFFVGGSSLTYERYVGQGPVALPLGITLRPLDLITMALAVVVLVAVGLALTRTRLGKATRAVSDNPALASASGIDVDRVIRTVWVVGTLLAGLSGVVLGLQQGVSFQMGFQILLLVFAAVTLGGLGTAFGALVGSLVVGVFVEVSTLFVPSELRNVGALVILIVVLLVRPQGILGRAQRVG